MMRVMIDPGHGGRDSGAVSTDGLALEKDIVLTVGRRVRRILKPFGEVEMTRDDDTFVRLSKRAEMANEAGADLLSIHCNAGGGHGFEAFTSPGETQSDSWASEVLDQLGQRFPSRTIRKDLRDGDADKEARFTVLTRTEHAAVLVELGFIDTDEGREFLTDPNHQERMAQALAEATMIKWGLRFRRPDQAMSLEQRIRRLEEIHGLTS